MLLFLLSYGGLPPGCHSSNQLHFPKHSIPSNTIVDQGDYCFVLESGHNLSYIFANVCPEHPYVQFRDCFLACCADQNVDGLNQVTLVNTPVQRHCHEDLWVGDSDFATGDALITFYGALDRIENPFRNYTFVGCVLREFSDDFGASFDTGVDGLYEGLSNGEEVNLTRVSLQNSIEIRLWDLSPGCYFNWYYSRPVTGPVGSTKGTAVYCRDEATCRGINITHSTETKGYPVDDFFQPSVCLGAIFIRPSSIVSSHSDLRHDYGCRARCLEDPEAEVALISPLNCLCGTMQALPKATPMSRVCEPCPGEADLECGTVSPDGDSPEFYSVYVLRENEVASTNYKYWQCVGNPLSNPPEQVLDPSLRMSFEPESPADCINACEANGFPIALLQSPADIEGVGNLAAVNCTCLAMYKFR